MASQSRQPADFGR
jgi:hypothetical protein